MPGEINKQSTSLIGGKYKDVPESNWSRNIKKLDIFFQDIEIYFEHGKPKLQTHCGVLMGFIMVLIIVLYGFAKADTMVNYLDNTIQEPSTKNHFDFDYVYNSKDGFRVAFGLTAYDSSSDPRELDESFGTLAAYLKIWGEKDAAGQTLPTYFKRLETRPCNKNDINLDNDENQDKYLFYSPSAEFAKDLNRFYPKLECLVNDDAELQGDYNSEKASQLVIRFEVCIDAPNTPVLERKCKDLDEIHSWMNRKFILALENQVTFQKDKVEDEKISKSSKLVWNVLSPQLRLDQYNYVRLTELDLTDKIGSVASPSEIHKMFTIEEGPVRPYDFPRPDTTQLAITYELSRDLNIIRRKVYGVLDFLGDLGGLAGALRGLFAVIVLLFQYKVVLNYVSNHTFLIQDGDENDKKSAGAIQDHDTDKGETVLKRIPIGFFSGIWLSIQRILHCCTCCHSNRDKFSHAADRMVKEELKIVGWVQHMRCQKLAMKKLFTEAEWKEIELEAKFRTLAIDP